MRVRVLTQFAAGITMAAAIPGAAQAQAWTPGSEIAGEPIQITTNGVTNTVYFDQGGAARIMTPHGNMVNGTWTASAGHLCLSNGTAQECWPYAAPFQAGQPVTWTSTCNATSTWLASAINSPTPPPEAAGERGK